MEGGLVEEGDVIGVAAVDISGLECLELGVESAVAAQLREGLLPFLIVAHEPEVGIVGVGEHFLGSESHASAVLYLGEWIHASGILDEPSHSGISSGDAPGIIVRLIHNDAGPGGATGGLLADFLIASLDILEIGGGDVGLSEEETVEFHPFRLAEGEGLHIVGTFEDGDSELRHLCVSVIVLEGGEHHDVGA